MPYKFNESRRHKIKKTLYRVSNWSDNNNSLRERGNFTVYFTEESIAGWHPPKTGSRCCPQKYSVLAIETSVMICQVFHLPLRQTQGFMTALVNALDVDFSVSDFSRLSKHSISLSRYKLTKALELGQHYRN